MALNAADVFCYLSHDLVSSKCLFICAPTGGHGRDVLRPEQERSSHTGTCGLLLSRSAPRSEKGDLHCSLRLRPPH